MIWERSVGGGYWNVWRILWRGSTKAVLFTVTSTHQIFCSRIFIQAG